MVVKTLYINVISRTQGWFDWPRLFFCFFLPLYAPLWPWRINSVVKKTNNHIWYDKKKTKKWNQLISSNSMEKTTACLVICLRNLKPMYFVSLSSLYTPHNSPALCTQNQLSSDLVFNPHTTVLVVHSATADKRKRYPAKLKSAPAYMHLDSSISTISFTICHVFSRDFRRHFNTLKRCNADFPSQSAVSAREKPTPPPETIRQWPSHQF